jgi:hypothetical protein
MAKSDSFPQSKKLILISPIKLSIVFIILPEDSDTITLSFHAAKQKAFP